MASPDTIILLVVDYHAAIGGDHRVPHPYASDTAPIQFEAHSVYER